jgi:hypothetical protein
MREKPLLLSAFVLVSIGCTFTSPVIHASVFPRYLLPFFLPPLSFSHPLFSPLY